MRDDKFGKKVNKYVTRTKGERKDPEKEKEYSQFLREKQGDKK